MKPCAFIIPIIAVIERNVLYQGLKGVVDDMFDISRFNILNHFNDKRKIEMNGDTKG